MSWRLGELAQSQNKASPVTSCVSSTAPFWGCEDSRQLGLSRLSWADTQTHTHVHMCTCTCMRFGFILHIPELLREPEFPVPSLVWLSCRLLASSHRLPQGTCAWSGPLEPLLRLRQGIYLISSCELGAFKPSSLVGAALKLNPVPGSLWLLQKNSLVV